MMQSEQEEQRNLQQSGAAGQRNTQHATNIKSGACAGKSKKNAKNQKNICGSNNSAGSFAASRTSFVQGFLNHWNVKSEATLTAEGYPESLVQLTRK